MDIISARNFGFLWIDSSAGIAGCFHFYENNIYTSTTNVVKQNGSSLDVGKYVNKD